MTDWTDAELFEAWEERAAIIEHDGKASRHHANYLAAKWLRDAIKPRQLPITIIGAMRADELPRQAGIIGNPT